MSAAGSFFEEDRWRLHNKRTALLHSYKPWRVHFTVRGLKQGEQTFAMPAASAELVMAGILTMTGLYRDDFDRKSSQPLVYEHKNGSMRIEIREV